YRCTYHHIRHDKGVFLTIPLRSRGEDEKLEMYVTWFVSLSDINVPFQSFPNRRLSLFNRVTDGECSDNESEEKYDACEGFDSSDIITGDEMWIGNLRLNGSSSDHLSALVSLPRQKINGLC